ncbi:MAG: hypothetical protein ABI560_04800 [Myxococcales bacterium]
MPDQASCEETVLTSPQLVADVKAGKVIYDGQAAAACLDLYRVLGCNVSDAASIQSSQVQSCREMFKGTVATGAACLTSEQCQSQDCDKSDCPSTACCAGACVARISEGGVCAGFGAYCADDLVCRVSGTDNAGICTALIAGGQPCTSRDSCVPGRVCNVVKGTNAGTCGVLPSRGQECPGMACDSVADFCDPASKTCVGRVPVGGDCAGLPTGCVVYARCDVATMNCVARKRVGEACAQSNDCLIGVECTGGVCVPPPDEPVCM